MKYSICESVIAEDFYEVEADSFEEAFKAWERLSPSVKYIKTNRVDHLDGTNISISDVDGDMEEFSSSEDL